ncbi:sulfatase-like hydrolase/transferase, partial [Pontiellaceae bacterium B12227]|nr:sulfatase-like hydrolase/transferase [Pontiellaceae bacterium B12227]
YASFTGAGYLEINRNSSLKTGTFTVSYWWRSSNLLGQGNFQGPSFSTEAGSTQDFQFTTIGSGGSGNLEVRDTAQLIKSDTELYPDGVWYNTVIQSAGGGTFDIWISAEDGSLTQVGDDVAASNGGLVLEDFIFGANRAKNAFGTFDLANVKIYDDATASAESLFAEGPMLVPPPPPPAPIAVYDFGNGDLVDDSSGNGYALAGPLGGAANIAANADGFSAHFDGSGGDGLASYFEADLNADDERFGGFTVSFWWRTDTLGQDTHDSLMSSKDTLSLNDWQLDHSGSDIRLYGDNGSITQPQDELSQGIWHHTAIVSDGANVFLYVTEGGAEAVHFSGSTTGAFNLQDLRIGANRAGNLTYDADMAYVRVYDEPLSPEQLNELLAELDINHAPVARDQAVATAMNTGINILLKAMDPDGDGLVYEIVDAPGNGTLSGGATNLTYTPDLDFVGNDSLTFVANDGALGSNTGTVSIAVGIPVIADFSADDRYVTTTGTPVLLSWVVSNATTVSISPSIGNVVPFTTNGVGQISVLLNEPTTYTLVVTNGAFSAQEQISLHIGPARPNLIIFLADDLGMTDTSVEFILDGNGNPVTYRFNDFYQTPNMETLATTGMRFTTAYAHTICSPSRASIMTGRTAARHAISNFIPASNADWPPNWREAGLDATDVTLPAILKQNGYRTIHCGKGHFSRSDFSILDLGFDMNIGGVSAGEPDSYTNWSESRVPNVPGSGTGTFLTQALAIEANKAIEDAVDDGKPFFLYMSFYAVHAVNSQTPRFPINPHATGDYRDAVSVEHQGFATMVEGMDMAVGSIRQKVIDLGLGEDSFVIFLGDNGTDSPAAGSNGLGSGIFSDFPVRGKKGFKWEGGTRVPFIASWITPNAENALQQATPVLSNSIQEDMVAIWDVPVTMLALAGIDNPAGFGEDGRDLAPYFAGTPGEHRPQEIVVHFPHNRGSNDGSASYFSWIRQGDKKLIYNFFTNTHELYDLASDPIEASNLAGTDPDGAMALTRRLAQMLDSQWGYGPLKPAAAVRDTENVIEIPNTPAVDLDADGLADTTEDANANGLLDDGETDPDEQDTDHDGTDDYTEVRLNLDPRNSDESFRAYITGPTAEGITLTWPSAPGVTFDIRSTTNLQEAVAMWPVVASNISPHTTSDRNGYDMPVTEESLFFKVVLREQDIQ